MRAKYGSKRCAMTQKKWNTTNKEERRRRRRKESINSKGGERERDVFK